MAPMHTLPSLPPWCTPVRCLLWGFVLVAAGIQLATPIQMYDTDLWYHLLAGQHFLTQGSLSTTSYFSFLEPLRQWTPYSWAFQVTAALLHDLGGDALLVVWRCGIYLLTCLLLFGVYLAPSQVGSATPRDSLPRLGALGAILAIVSCLALLPRELNLRPHMFSYLGLAWIVWVLEARPQWRWSLPLATLVMANYHGIEYPVAIGVLGGYFLEDLVRARKETGPARKAALRPMVWYVAALAALLCTPYGVGLFPTPVTGAALQHLVIHELLRFEPANHLFLSAYPLTNLLQGSTTVVLLLWVLAVGWCAWRRSLRIPHVLTTLMLVVLLHRHARFTMETVILVAPLIRHAALLLPLPTLPRQAGMGLAAAVLALMAVIGVAQVTPMPRWPLSETRLPAATARFLNAQGPGGTVLSPPSINGYMQWALYPKYRTFADLQMHLFTEQDLFINLQAFTSPVLLQKLREQYDIDLLLCPPEGNPQAFMVNFPDFIPVYVEGTGVLHLDKTRHPELAERLGIRHFNPYTLAGFDPTQPGLNATAALAEMEALLEVAGENLLLRRAAGISAAHLGDLQRAQTHRQAIEAWYPEGYHGYEVAGLIAFREARYADAADAFSRALKRAPAAHHARLRQNAYVSSLRGRLPDQAWELASQAINPYATNVTPMELHELAVAAASSGQIPLALTFLDMAAVLAPADDAAFAALLQKSRALYTAAQEGP